jgi:hypothetical protein
MGDACDARRSASTDPREQLRAVEAAYDAAAGAIEADPDGRRAFSRIGELAALLSRLRREMGWQR